MPPVAARWTLEQAEEHLLGLELFGMRFGLERVRALLARLGDPQRRLRAIHVVGTNGKSSTVRLASAILHAHGLRAGAYLSPHLSSFTERVRVDDRDAHPDDLAEAIRTAAGAAAEVDATLDGEERCTQFEVLTAAALHELARREVEVAVVEAGLGGRFDATNALEGEVCVLTGVALEHTRWLGDTVDAIAREKLAVVPAGGRLVIGDDLHPDALARARALDARLIVAPPVPGAPALAAKGAFQRRNLALARAAAQAFLAPRALHEAAVGAAAAATTVPGRLQRVGDDPPTYLDGAHNPDGMGAVIAAVGEEAPGAPVTAVVSVLADKDVEAILAALAPSTARIVTTTNHNPRALGAAELADVARRAGSADVRAVEDPHAALATARALAREEHGVVLATGSIYLVADLLRPDGAAGPARRSTL